MNSKTLEYHLHDLGGLLKREALEAASNCLNANSEDKLFYEGKKLAYYEVLSFVLQQAKAFDIDPFVLGLDDFNPDDAMLAGNK